MPIPDNAAIRRATLHYAIQSFASAAGGVFILAFLLKAGVSVPFALLYSAGIVGSRYLIRPAVLPLAIRFGVKPLLIAGTLLSAASFVLIGQVTGPGWPLVALCLFNSLGYLLYFGSAFTPISPPWATPTIAAGRSGCGRRSSRASASSRPCSAPGG